MRGAGRRLVPGMLLAGAMIAGALGATPVDARPISGSDSLHIVIPGVSTSGASSASGVTVVDFPSVFGCGVTPSAGVGNAQTSGLCVRVP